MARFTKAEIKLRRGALEIWRYPSEMLELCRVLMDSMGSADLFNQPGVDFILEGWSAAKFALARGAEAVRLVSARDQWPDFDLHLNGEVTRWELTEADQPGRRRGAEYRERARRIASSGSSTREDPVEKWIERAEQAPAAIRDRCLNKARKHYRGRAALLVYLNLSEYGIRQQEIEASLADATAPAKDAFTEVWVLWNDLAYGIWRSGARMPREPK